MVMASLSTRNTVGKVMLRGTQRRRSNAQDDEAVSMHVQRTHILISGHQQVAFDGCRAIDGLAITFDADLDVVVQNALDQNDDINGTGFILRCFGVFRKRRQGRTCRLAGLLCGNVQGRKAQCQRQWAGPAQIAPEPALLRVTA